MATETLFPSNEAPAGSGSETGDNGVDHAASAFDVIFGNNVSKDDGAAEPARKPAPAKREAAAAPDRSPESEDEAPEVHPDDVPADDEAEPEDEEASEDDTETEDEDEDPEIDLGDERKAKLSELKESHKKAEDYTRKTQELAEDKRVYYEYASTMVKEREALIKNAQELYSLATALEPSAEDWAAMKAKNPVAYAEAKDTWDEIQKKKEAIVGRVAQELQNKAVAEGREQERYVTAELAKTREVLPVLFDPKRGKGVKERMVKYAESLGYTAEEVAGAVDHREILTLYRAMRFMEAQGQAPRVGSKPANEGRQEPKPAQGNRPPQAQGRNRAPGARTVLAQAQKSLAKTGRTEDAAMAFTAMFRK